MTVNDGFEFVLNGISACLKRNGFSRDHHLWHRRTPAFLQMLSLQKSQWNTNEEVCFTFNLGFFSPDAAQIATQYFDLAMTKKKTMSNCFPQLRIGYASPVDVWWTLHNPPQSEPVLESCRKRLEEETIPMLDSMESPEKLVYFLRGLPRTRFLPGVRDRLFYLGLLAFCGEIREAEYELRNLRDQTKDNALTQKLQAFEHFLQAGR